MVPVTLGGCAVRARYYDRDHHEYRRWNHHEEGYYERWEHDTHRDHRDFRDRSQQGQNAYWLWRYDHPQGQ